MRIVLKIKDNMFKRKKKSKYINFDKKNCKHNMIINQMYK